MDLVPLKYLYYNTLSGHLSNIDTAFKRNTITFSKWHAIKQVVLCPDF